jgi:hypothetical protein
MQLKRLIKTRKKIEPFKVYQLEDCFTAELDDVEVFRTKHQHLATSYCEIKLAEKRNAINQQKIEQVKEFRAQGII